MKVKSEPTPVGAGGVILRNGDSITCGYTHEILVNGDKSWVKFEATTTQGEEETTKEATDRLIAYVNEAVMTAVHRGVETIEGMQS